MAPRSLIGLTIIAAASCGGSGVEMGGGGGSAGIEGVPSSGDDTGGAGGFLGAGGALGYTNPRG